MYLKLGPKFLAILKFIIVSRPSMLMKSILGADSAVD
jgi:hypothetical protein